MASEASGLPEQQPVFCLLLSRMQAGAFPVDLHDIHGERLRVGYVLKTLGLRSQMFRSARSSSGAGVEIFEAQDS